MKRLIQISFEEVCRECGLSADGMQKFINEEWVSPANRDDLRFDQEDLTRIYLIQELRNTFDVNDEAIPIILSLIDQLIHLQNTLKKLSNF